MISVLEDILYKVLCNLWVVNYFTLTTLCNEIDDGHRSQYLGKNYQVFIIL